MLEQENIQSRGFRNLYKGNKAIGFQFQFRSSYYRGIYLSQLRPVEVKVDGETFSEDQITITYRDKTYEQKDLPNHSDVYWQIYEPLTLNINKPGGLPLGIHEVEFGYTYAVCYSAPEEDLRWRTYTRRMTLAR